EDRLARQPAQAKGGGDLSPVDCSGGVTVPDESFGSTVAPTVWWRRRRQSVRGRERIAADGTDEDEVRRPGRKPFRIDRLHGPIFCRAVRWAIIFRIQRPRECAFGEIDSEESLLKFQIVRRAIRATPKLATNSSRLVDARNLSGQRCA